MIQVQLLWAGILLGIDLLAKPSLSLFGVVLAVVLIDFVTGVTKAKMKKQERTSEGFRKTLVKLMQYMIPVFLLWMAGKYIPEYTNRLQMASGFVMMFIIYIEITSIFENLYDIDSRSMIAKLLYKPALTILKFGLEKNPVANAAEKVQQQIDKEHQQAKDEKGKLN